jgi:hypothetical protein
MKMMRRSTKPSAQKTVIAVGKRAAEEAKVFVGEVADAAAAAAATTRAMAGVIMNKVATAIEVRAAKGAKSLAVGVTTTDAEGRKPRSRAKEKVTKGAAAKKRVAPNKQPNTKKVSRKAAKKKRT